MWPFVVSKNCTLSTTKKYNNIKRNIQKWRYHKILSLSDLFRSILIEYIPRLIKSNEFNYPVYSNHFPELDIIKNNLS